MNTARFIFLDPRARDFYLDRDRAARDTVAVLRSAAGRDPYDRPLSDLVGELSTQSEAFRTHWASHNVRFHITGVKRFHHPVVSELSLNFERLELAADPGLRKLDASTRPCWTASMRSSRPAPGSTRSTTPSTTRPLEPAARHRYP